MRSCPPCLGTGKRWETLLVPCELCDGERLIPDPQPGQIECHHCKGTGREHGTLLKLCGWCGGHGYRFPKLQSEPQEDGPLAFIVQAGKPRTAHLTLLSILTSLDGELKICDPYYGTGTLLRLDPIADKPIRFLTRQPDSNEQSSGILPSALAEFGRQHPTVEFRRHPGNDLHDRYMLSMSELILLGHGLKDVGNKESFIVRLDRTVAKDLIDETTEAFDRKWSAALKLK